jgi:hypothetical protein
MFHFVEYIFSKVLEAHAEVIVGAAESIKTLVVKPMRTVRKPTQTADGPSRHQTMRNLNPQRIELCSFPQKLALARKLPGVVQPSKELAKRQSLVSPKSDLSRKHGKLYKESRIVN